MNDVYNNLAKDFSEYLKDFHNPPANHTTFHFGYKPVLDFVEKKKDSNALSVLDYGAGTGQFAAYLNLQGAKVCGVEPSDAMREVAQSNFPQLKEKFYSIEEAEAVFKIASFDIITMNFVTCEIAEAKELQKIFARAFNWLKPSGSLVILTSNPEQQPSGAEFVSWATGSVDIDTEGSSFRVTIYDEGKSFELNDYFWSKKYITNELVQSGLTQIRVIEPSLKDIEQKTGWKEEANISPTLIYTAFKL